MTLLQSLLLRRLTRCGWNSTLQSGNGSSLLELILMQEQHWQVPEWWYREKRPANDNAYFENMSRVIFQAGLNWRVIDNKWPTIKKAFANFNINKVASFTNADVERLMKDPGVVRNKGKIQATIQNAIRFQAIQ